MAVTTLPAAIEADLQLRAYPALRDKLIHNIKIGGDGSHDASEKEKKSSSILLILFAWLAMLHLVHPRCGGSKHTIEIMMCW